MFHNISEKEFGVSDLLSASWAVYCKRFKTIIGMMCLLAVPSIVSQWIAVEAAKDSSLSIGAGILFVVVAIAIAAAGVVLTYSAHMGIICIIEDAVKDNGIEMGWKVAIKKGFSRFWSSLGTAILATLIVLGLYLLLVIPGIIWSLYYMFFMHVVVLRGLGGKTALNYSKSVVKGHWWKTFWRLLVVSLLNMVIFFGAAFILFFLPEALRIIIGAGIYITVIGFGMTTITVLFLNLECMSKKDMDKIAQ